MNIEFNRLLNSIPSPVAPRGVGRRDDTVGGAVGVFLQGRAVPTQGAVQ